MATVRYLITLLGPSAGYVFVLVQATGTNPQLARIVKSRYRELTAIPLRNYALPLQTYVFK